MPSMAESPKKDAAHSLQERNKNGKIEDSKGWRRGTE